MSCTPRIPLPGSERSLEPGHARVGELDPATPVELSVYLAHRVAPDWIDREAARPPGERRRLSREQWREAHGADPAHMGAVREFAEGHGLELVGEDPGRRRVRVRAALGTAAEAFEAQLAGLYAAPGAGARAYRARTGPLTVPTELGDIVRGVFGFDDRPQARPQIRFAAAGAVAYPPPQVAAAYDFPSGVDASSQTVGIIELGGGYRQADLTTYFDGLGIAAPTVTAVTVDGGANDPGADTDADGEVMLDIEIVGSVAPGASIVVYFAANTDQGFIDAVSQAVHDTTHRSSVLSISWGGPEDSWTTQARAQMETILTDAGGLGVTVTVAAGDNGSSDGVSGGGAHVDFPASAPHALGCGGTTLGLSGSGAGSGPGSGTGSAEAITSETVWSTTSDGATGGGVSDAFALPSYQAAAKVPMRAGATASGRGVPDVAGDANPQTGYTIRVDGSDETVGGTSAVAPLWAGLITLLNASASAPLGFLQPRLYPLLGSDAFHDIVSGSNGAYAAGPGWDACSGLGSPVGATLAQRLAGG